MLSLKRVIGVTLALCGLFGSAAAAQGWIEPTRPIVMPTPDAVVSPILVPFGTDSNAFRHKGAMSYGVFPITVPADLVASMHSDAERVPAAEIGTGIQILFEALRAIQ